MRAIWRRVLDSRANKFLAHPVVSKCARATRVAFISYTIYCFGYNQGMMEYARDPVTTETSFQKTTLAGRHCAALRVIYIKRLLQYCTEYMQCNSMQCTVYNRYLYLLIMHYLYTNSFIHSFFHSFIHL